MGGSRGWGGLAPYCVVSCDVRREKGLLAPLTIYIREKASGIKRLSSGIKFGISANDPTAVGISLGFGIR